MREYLRNDPNGGKASLNRTASTCSLSDTPRDPRRRQRPRAAKRAARDVAGFMLDASAARWHSRASGGRHLVPVAAARVLDPRAKPRLISALPFRDRVVQHLLVAATLPRIDRCPRRSPSRAAPGRHAPLPAGCGRAGQAPSLGVASRHRKILPVHRPRGAARPAPPLSRRIRGGPSPANRVGTRPC